MHTVLMQLCVQSGGVQKTLPLHQALENPVALTSLLLVTGQTMCVTSASLQHLQTSRFRILSVILFRQCINTGPNPKDPQHCSQKRAPWHPCDPWSPSVTGDTALASSKGQEIILVHPGPPGCHNLPAHQQTAFWGRKTRFSKRGGIAVKPWKVARKNKGL